MIASILALVFGNLLMAGAIAAAAILVGRLGKNTELVHALWLLVLIKLATPPLAPLNWLPSPSWISPPTTEIAMSRGDEFIQSRRIESSPVDVAIYRERATDLNQSMRFDRNILLNDGLAPSLREVSGAGTARQELLSESGVLPSVSPNEVLMQAPLLMNRLPAALMILWVAGSAGWLVLTWIRIHRFGRLLRLAEFDKSRVQNRVQQIATRIGLNRVPRLYVVPGPVAPMVWPGLRGHRLILPQRLIGQISDRQLDSIIAHELVHLRCGHHRIRWFEMLISIVYWWCPLIWTVRRKLRETEEEICDAWVVHIMPDNAKDYAMALVDTAKFLSTQPSVLPQTAMGLSHFHTLQRRITMILLPQTKPGLSPAAWLTLLAIMLLSVPFTPALASSRPQAADLNGEGFQDPDRDRDDKDREDEDRDEDQDRDREQRQDKQEIAKEIEEMIAEVTEEFGELTKELESEIEELRDELKEEIGEMPSIALQALKQIRIEKLVQDSTQGVPRIVKMFVDEIDPASIVKEVLRDQKIEGGDFKEEELGELQKELQKELRNVVQELSQETQRELKNVKTEITRELQQLPESVRNRVARQLQKVLEELAGDASPIGKEFIEELEIRKIIRDSLGQSRDREQVEQDRERRRESDSDENRIERERIRRRSEVDNEQDELAARRKRLEQRLEALMNEINELRKEVRELDRRERRDRKREDRE